MRLACNSCEILSSEFRREIPRVFMEIQRKLASRPRQQWRRLLMWPVCRETFFVAACSTNGMTRWRAAPRGAAISW